MESSFFTTEATQETHALMVGVAMISALLSIPSFVWNLIMVLEAKEKRDIIGTIISVATFIFGMGFLIFAFVHRVHVNGGRLF